MSVQDTAASQWRRLWDRGRNTTPRDTLTSTPISSNFTPTSTQQTIQNQSLHNDDTLQFGDILRSKKINTIRIHTHNINNLPAQKNTYKNHNIVQFLQIHNIDITLYQEIGLNWRHVNHYESWYARMSDRGISGRSSISHNTTEPTITGKYQSGGTITTALSDIHHKVIKRGQDTLG